MRDYYPYCERCLEKPAPDAKEFYDYRFDKPICLSCVEEYGLEPTSCGHSKLECPKHGGAFDCTPFCQVCEGNQEYCPFCDYKAE
jgi:hypothetical protein